MRHIAEVARNEFKTPLLNDIFSQAQKAASFDLLSYVNADIILMSDFLRAIEQVKAKKKTFMLAGAKRNLDITEFWDFSQPDWEERLRALVQRYYPESGRDHRLGAEYFVFPRGLFRDIPALTLRWSWDGWLLWKAAAQCGFLIDATAVVFAVHQNHDYSHIHTNGESPWLAEEAMRNVQLAGIPRYWFLYEATHSLTPRGIKRLWFQKSLFRLRQLLIYRLGRVRHRLGLRRATLDKLKKKLRGLFV